MFSARPAMSCPGVPGCMSCIVWGICDTGGRVLEVILVTHDPARPYIDEGLNKLLRLFGYAGEEKPKLTYVEKYRRLGSVTRLTDRGLGFIESRPLSKDLFFHHVELQDIFFDDLREGDMITFLAGTGTHGLVAMEVQRY